ncbi:MAG TPA: 3-dehydroquinate synthase [Pyrinomonadaceae bacterium]|nr:3-dehydroquinate synthase [Pyrinomonadaceae bacterium]
MSEIKIKFSERESNYSIKIGSGYLASIGAWISATIGHCGKAMIVSNPTVFGIYGKSVEDSLAAAGYTVSKFLMSDGEEYKTLATATKALKSMSSAGLERTDFVVALGGGVVGDLAGFAASVYLRGIKFLQIPTTLLSMVDSSVGGKTGVNAAFGKNMIGAFHQPSGVLVETDVLATLPERELTAGLCEMVKHSAISGPKLMESTLSWLKDRDGQNLQKLIASNISFKAKIVAGDEFESPSRVDARSRKILNFGHTLAHALEKVTNLSYFRHGEAVGYGILYAAELSKSLDLIDKKSVNLLYDVVRCVGKLPPLEDIVFDEVFEAFRFDKKRSAGTLQMVLLKGLGRPVIVDAVTIPHKHHQNAFERLRKF